MEIEIVDSVVEIETIAIGKAIREIALLERTYGPGRRRKLKGEALIRLPNG